MARWLVAKLPGGEMTGNLMGFNGCVINWIIQLT